MVKFQYISNLHLDLYPLGLFDIDAIAPYLLLAGDIGNPYQKKYELFLENISKKFEKIFIISGNHEYYYQ
jgi:hypothetical protein